MISRRQRNRIVRQCTEIAELAAWAASATEIGVIRMGAEWLARDLRQLELGALRKEKEKNHEPVPTHQRA